MPRSEPAVNKQRLLLQSPGNVLSVGMEGRDIIVYDDLFSDDNDTPAILVRPFFIANYGRGAAINLAIFLDGERISERLDYIVEPYSKLRFELMDAIEYNPKMKNFTLSYNDIFGNEYSVTLDGSIEQAVDETEAFKRDVYLFYVNGFAEGV